VDVVWVNKGTVYVGFEVVHRNKKEMKLKEKLGPGTNTRIYEINAMDILKAVKKPECFLPFCRKII
jgi:hypothetical protein